MHEAGERLCFLAVVCCDALQGIDIGINDIQLCIKALFIGLYVVRYPLENCDNILGPNSYLELESDNVCRTVVKGLTTVCCYFDCSVIL